MTFIRVQRILKKIGLTGLVLHLTAFTAPQKDQMIELKGFLYGRGSAKFRSFDDNKLYVLKPGTRAVIAETKYFPESKNYGLCLDVQNATHWDPEQKCVWVYYNVRETKNPEMVIYANSADQAVHAQVAKTWSENPTKVHLNKSSRPAKGKLAETTRTVSGVVEKKEAASAGVDSETPAKIGLESLNKINRQGNEALSSNGQVCVECSKPKLQAYESCSSKNNYIENALQTILNQSPNADFFQSPQREIISSSCIQKNMSVFTKAPAYFRTCANGQAKRVAKACISENYVNVTAKSFNLAADCLGDYVSGSESGKGQAALSIFSLMSLESGMNVNAMSGTGPGGPGQMSGGAIAAVNQDLPGIRAHLAQSKNNFCSQTLAKTLEKPMSSSALCDRISPSRDNPLKSMAYAFAYQAAIRRVLEKQAFNQRIFSGVLSENLPSEERDRLMMELSSWAHNTGPTGILNPLRAQLISYLKSGRTVQTAQDVNRFLLDLRSFLVTHAHPSNRSRSRVRETMNYYQNIQNRMALIAEEPRTCLAN